MPGHHHRSGPLKQSNKRNKRSKASKRSLSKAAGGKVMARLTGGAAVGQQSKADRRNHAAQLRRTKKEEMMRRKRGIDVSSLGSNQLPPPKVVGILALGDAGQGLEDRLRNAMLESADRVVHPHEEKSVTVLAKYDVHKKDGYLTYLTCRSSFAPQYEKEGESATLLAALDLARICDLLIIAVDGNATRNDEGEGHILSMEIGGDDDPSVHTNKTGKTSATTASQRWDHLINAGDDHILSAIKSQGLPNVLTVLAHTQKEAPDQMTVQSVKSLRRSAVKRKLDLKRYVTRFATTEFGNNNDRVVEVDLADHEESRSEMMDDNTSASPSQQHTVNALVRTICGMSGRPSTWISNSPRNYVLSDTFAYDPITRQMNIQGFVRGMAPMDVNSLIHVPCMGTFRCMKVSKSSSPLTPQHRAKKDVEMTDDNENCLVSNPEYQESTEMFATPDSLAGEQNLIGFDEAEEYEQDDEEDKNDTTFARPAGWSDYQAAWLDGVDEPDAVDEIDHGELAAQLNKKSADSVVEDIDMMDANRVSEEERKALIEQRRKEQTEHAEFPDEVQVGDDEKARDRFARYRSLKSFRKSFWDPKENLPDSYASLFHFSSFKATQRAIMNDRKDSMRAAQRAEGNFFGKSPDTQQDTSMSDSEDEPYDPLEGCVPTGTYVTLTLADVPEESFRLISPSSVVTAVTLLSHENKMSVLHAGLTTPASSISNNNEDGESVPVKSKDVLIFRCGWRTWTGRPIFSQNNLNCDKHKFERYRPDEGFYAASWFGPVTYTPCPVLAFRKTASGRLELVAHGSLMSADADRIIVKRILLTGYPVKVRKRHAVVKYMFNNPEDVLWFKPAGLHTKHGLIGNIEESVGDHGTMKCLFHAPIKQHDTVCLPLYKRIYPKFAPMGGEAASEGGTVASAKQPRLLVR